MPNLPLTYNRTCSYILAFQPDSLPHLPSEPSLTPLTHPPRTKCHCIFSSDSLCLVQAIYLSPVRLALDAYITAGLARVDRNSKRVSKFYPYSLNSSVLS